MFSSLHKGLSVKFALTITAVVAGVAFTIGAVIVTLDWQRFHRELENRALLLAHSIAVTAPEDILQSDFWSLYKSLKIMANKVPGGTQDTHILTGMILDTDGIVLAHLDPNNNPLGIPPVHSSEIETQLFAQAREVRTPTILNSGVGNGGFLEGVAPIYSDEKLLGIVRVRLSKRELYLKAQRSTFIIIGLTLALVALGSLLGTAISRRITMPLSAMTEGMEAVGRGEFSNIKPIPVGNDDELGILASAFNKMAKEMAEKKSLEEQIAVSEKLVALGRISAGVAHEVNNPLAGLMNCIDTLKKHPEDPELVERYLPLLDKGLNRIKNIVESLLVELRIEEAHSTDSSSSLDDLRDIVESEINGRDIDFVWDNHLGTEVMINKRRVQQIVLNLLKNSIQALHDKGTVVFRTFQDGNCIILEVSDNGPGIPPENRKQLFDPFFTTKKNGTGLGLWIVYRLVESMRGVIEVESEVGNGTQFQVTLPAMEVST
ncbi:MAG: HAMP domain-containing protein [Rhodospirillaceae bacterium]|nr:HAMP domain-containing protein [Rhodospirillaceae bacterium]MBT5245791.1 HAMP domain-containing protein [Rhodospirillaceae bacterium]MBT6242454.1 HAMP domain-containing protein [Rhodospirillaceae bacterium]MBT7136352.1 HAMP domain-containing protein [Rhodospirillaceae bacterium]